MYSPWMVCLRVGNHGVVGGGRQFPTFEKADSVRKDMLRSPSVRAMPYGSVGVLVMHYKKFKELLETGEACTIQRLKQNSAMFGEALSAESPLASTVDKIDITPLQKALREVA